MGDDLPQNRRLLHLEKWFCHKSKLLFWPFILNQTMNADILSPLQWHIVLTGSSQISVRPCNGICYTRTTLFNTWKTSIAINISRYFHHFHDYTHSEHTRVALSADWLHLDTFPLMGDALPQTQKAPRHLEKRLCHKSKSVSWPLYWIRPWRNTFWAHFSSTESWQTSPGHLFTHERCSTAGQKIDVYLARRSMYTWRPYLTP